MGSGASRGPGDSSTSMDPAVFNQGGWMTQSFRQRQASRRSTSRVHDKSRLKSRGSTGQQSQSSRHPGTHGYSAQSAKPFRGFDPLNLRDAINETMVASQSVTPFISRLCFGNIGSLYSVVHDGHGNAGMVGEGSSCQVFMAKRNIDGRKFAVKRLTRKASQKVVLSELRILRQVDHPNIVLLHDTFVDDVDLTVHFVLEYCGGGDLFDNLKKRGHFSEPTAARMLVKMFQAVEHLHARQIAHRDLKLENWVMRSSSGDAAGDLEPVLIDFGLSHQLATPDERMSECLGTSFYVAPETVRKNYGLTCDIWALGVITYMILSGKTPFGGKDDQEVLHRILHCNVTFISPVWGSVSSTAKDFICSLLRKNPAERFSIQQAYEHPWLAENGGRLPATSPSFAAARYQAAQELLERMQVFLDLPTFLKMAMALWASDGPVRADEHVCGIFDLLSESGSVQASLCEIFVDGREKRAFAEAFEKLSDLAGGQMSFRAFCALYLAPRDLPTYNGGPETMHRIFEALSTADEVITASSLRACLGTMVVSSPSEKPQEKRLRRGQSSQGSAMFIAILEEIVQDSRGQISRDAFRDVLLGKVVVGDAVKSLVDGAGQRIAHDGDAEEEEEESKEDDEGDDDDDDEEMIDITSSSAHPEMSSSSRAF